MENKVYCVREPKKCNYKIKSHGEVTEINIKETGGRVAARKIQMIPKIKYKKNEVKVADPAKDGPRSHGIPY